MCAYHGTVLIACPDSRMHAQSGARESKQNMQLRHPSNPHASKVSRRVELMTTALKTVRRVTTKKSSREASRDERVRTKKQDLGRE